MEKYAECQKCKARFLIDKDIVQYQKEFKDKNGQSIYLSYYDCHRCGRRHWVQIDDSNSILKLNEQKKLFIRLSKQKAARKAISKKQSAKHAKIQRDLSDYRIKLMKEFTGKTVADVETGMHYILEFSV